MRSLSLVLPLLTAAIACATPAPRQESSPTLTRLQRTQAEKQAERDRQAQAIRVVTEHGYSATSALRRGDCSKLSGAEAISALPGTLYLSEQADARALLEFCSFVEPAAPKDVLARFDRKRDDIDRRTFFVHSLFAFKHRRIAPKLEAYVGQHDGQQPYLRLRARTSGGGWLFARSFTIAAAEHRFEFAGRFTRENTGDTWETVDLPFNDRAHSAVTALIRSGGTVRFRGQRGHRDYTLSTLDRAALRDALQAHRVLSTSSAHTPTKRRSHLP